MVLFTHSAKIKGATDKKGAKAVRMNKPLVITIMKVFIMSESLSENDIAFRFILNKFNMFLLKDNRN